MATSPQIRRKKALLGMNAALVTILSSAMTLLYLRSGEPEATPAQPADQSLKNTVDIARVNVTHNVLEANYAVGRMNINGINSDDCAALSTANRLVQVNADFVRANIPALQKSGDMTSFEAEDLSLLMDDITNDKDAERLTTEQRCLTPR